tara:strand:+ start:5777 stop:7051 length:1275 start_codon:yes stop_codon:yes gene_type:complete
MKHFDFGPSAMHRKVRCAASSKVERGYVNYERPEALEGTAAHDLADVCGNDQIKAKDYVPDKLELEFDNPKEFEGLEIPGVVIKITDDLVRVTYPISDEMRRGVDLFLDECRCHGTDIYFEEQVSFSDYIPGGFGTADFFAFVFDPELNGYICTLIDFKFGHIFVPVENNYQLLGYALGVLQTWSWLYNIVRFDLMIVQPRHNYIDTWTVEAYYVQCWGEDVLTPAWEASQQIQPEYSPGDIQCRYCLGRGECKPYAMWMLEKVRKRFDELPVNDESEVFEPDILSDEELGQLCQSLGHFATWELKVKEIALARMEDQHEIPGQKIVISITRRKISDPVKMEKQLRKDGYKKADLYNQTLKTITQLEKMVDADYEGLDEFIYKPEGRRVIAPLSDRRKALVAIKSDVFDAFDASDEEETKTTNQ